MKANPLTDAVKITVRKPEREAGLAATHGSATCQHRMGHYIYTGTRTTGEEYKQCGKRATHVANYPKNEPFYLCRKHSKTRCYVSELPNSPDQERRASDSQTL